DVVMWGGVGLLALLPIPDGDGWRFGLLTAEDALEGLANEGIATIAVLFVVAVGLRETGALRLILQNLLGRPASTAAAQQRLLWPTAVLSAFLNNTPLVAMLLPVTDEWARRYSVSIGKLLMPLSFASILGGSCTLIGTSTNLIVNGWLIKELDHPGLSMFAITSVALPLALVGMAYIFACTRWLLPDRVPPIGGGEDVREYTIEMIVEAGGDLVGQTVEQAGLRGLPGLFLIEIDRESEVLPAVSGSVQLRGDDRLVFAGVVESVADLQKIRGLRPATNQVFKINEPRHNRALIEAVVSNTCPLIGLTVKEGRFRTQYNAAVIAVGRNGERIKRKVGDIRLRPGDTLLLEARSSFVEQQRNRRDFYLVSRVDDSAPPNYGKSRIALAILAAMVLLVTAGVLSMLKAGMLAGGLMIATGCCSATAARRGVDWQVLLVIAAALALGNAMQISGLADSLGHGLRLTFGQNPTVMLAAIYGLAMVLASVVTAKAGAVLMLPVAVSAAADLNVSPMPYIIAVMLASATTLATPIGYPTNLMVYGPGGYRFSDYLRFGGPLTVLLWAAAVVVIPYAWPF
ncbi:MAG: anion permease, partial [Gammaproteobacteria bacterium]|nr:anion permease [Gammaproteobacteria bacterium]